jgi:hypothetical protein
MNTKNFTFDVVLTVTTGRLLTKPISEDNNGINKLYDILDWIMSESNYTHELGISSEKSKPFLLEKFPELQTVEDNIHELDHLLDSTNGYHARQKAINLFFKKCIETWGIQPSYDIPKMEK